MNEQAQEHVAKLRDFRTRKPAMDALVLMGDEAVPALVEALAHPMGNVRWAARTALCRIGSEAVTAGLLDALDDSPRAEEAARALRDLTGESLGADRQAWARYLDTGAEPEAAPSEAEAAPEAAPSEPLSDTALVDAAVEGTGAEAEHAEGRSVLTVPLEAGRQQRVVVRFGVKDAEGEALVVVYTECGPAEAKNYEWALRQNLRMAFGAIGLRDRDEGPTFVMVNTHARETVTPADLRKTVLLLARKGDALEKALTPEDDR